MRALPLRTAAPDPRSGVPAASSSSLVRRLRHPRAALIPGPNRSARKWTTPGQNPRIVTTHQPAPGPTQRPGPGPDPDGRRRRRDWRRRVGDGHPGANAQYARRARPRLAWAQRPRLHRSVRAVHRPGGVRPDAAHRGAVADCAAPRWRVPRSGLVRCAAARARRHRGCLRGCLRAAAHGGGRHGVRQNDRRTGHVPGRRACCAHDGRGCRADRGRRRGHFHGCPRGCPARCVHPGSEPCPRPQRNS